MLPVLSLGSPLSKTAFRRKCTSATSESIEQGLRVLGGDFAFDYRTGLW